MLMYLIISDSSFAAIIIFLFVIRFIANVLRALIDYIGDIVSGKMRAHKEQKKIISQDKQHSTNPEVYENDPQFRALIEELKKYYQNKDIRNIAVTGLRGAGKSSFIKTYESQNAMPFCGYMRLIVSSNLARTNLSEEELEKDLVRQVFRYVQGKEVSGKNLHRGLLGIVGIIAAGCIALLFAMNNYDKLSKVIPQKYSDKTEGYLTIAFILVLFVLVCILYQLFVRVVTFQSIKIKTAFGEAEADFKESPISDNMNDLIQALTKIRRKISYTVVVEDLESYNVQVKDCQMVHTKLIELNKQLNVHLSRLGFGMFFYIPVRFLFIYSDGIYDNEEEIKRFDGRIRIEGTLIISSLSRQINETLASCFDESDRKPHTLEQGKLLLSQEYLEKLNQYISDLLLNRRWMNDLLTVYGIEWKKLIHKLGDRPCAADDEKRLFSYILYKRLFPEDQKKMYSEKSLVFSVTSKKSVSEISKDRNKRDLFYYLVKECPESYRLSPLCMRYVNGFDPSLLGYYLDLYQKAFDEARFNDALKYINRVITCDPENAVFHDMCAEVYDKTNKKRKAKKERDTAQKCNENRTEKDTTERNGKKVEVEIKASEAEDIYYIQREARLQAVRSTMDEFFREIISGKVLDRTELEQKLSDYQLNSQKAKDGENYIYKISVPCGNETKKREKYDTEDVSVIIRVDIINNKLLHVQYRNFRDYVDVFCESVPPEKVLLKDFTLLSPAGIEWTEDGIGQIVSRKVFTLKGRETENLWNYEPRIDREGGNIKPFLEKVKVGMPLDKAIEEADSEQLSLSDIDTNTKCISCGSDIRGYQDGSCVYLYSDEEHQIIRDIRYYDYVALKETGKYIRAASGELSGKEGRLYAISEGYYITNDHRTQHFKNLDQSLQVLEQSREIFSKRRDTGHDIIKIS